jgi:hypothetical protein
VRPLLVIIEVFANEFASSADLLAGIGFGGIDLIGDESGGNRADDFSPVSTVSHSSLKLSFLLLVSIESEMLPFNRFSLLASTSDSVSLTVASDVVVCGGVVVVSVLIGVESFKVLLFKCAILVVFVRMQASN